MNLAIIGYGKMGKMIEQLATERGHTIGLIVDVENTQDLNAENLKDIDCSIEFTTPGTAVDNFITCFRNNVPVVSGTTGWLSDFEKVKASCKEHQSGFFYASNFSLGVNILFKLNRFLAGIMANFPEYDAAVTETHHIHKLDKPSGTAITLSEQIIAESNRKKNWSLTPESSDELKVTSIREDEIIGIHKIDYQSDTDKISISHEAFSRKGFAIGAIMAAEFLQNKKGIYGMDELLKSFNIN